MKRAPFVILAVLTFLVEAIFCFFFFSRISEQRQDTVAINECVHEVAAHFDDPASYPDKLRYAVIDTDGVLRYRSDESVSLSVNEAVQNNDTILDLNDGDEILGKIIIANTTAEKIRTYKNDIITTILIASAVQIVIMLSLFFYLQKSMIRPFDKLKSFAVRVAGGDLDIPLDMDKGHAFGEFTEAFDLMRSELSRSRAAEKKANDEKKETIAKLSHDIKTPVASIKSTSELGMELAGDDRTRKSFALINQKSDQITTLVDNLFNSSIQEITEIPVSPVKCDSSVIEDLIHNSDYMNRACAFSIPQCRVFIDKLRLQQAFDNIFMNSYKYADTAIDVSARMENDYLVITVSDHGPGVSADELLLLKEKYRRGGNASGKDGAGLGLYLTDYFLKEMDGRLELANCDPGFSALFYIRIL